MIDEIIGKSTTEEKNEEDEALQALRKFGTPDVLEVMNDYIRKLMREESFARRIMPPFKLPSEILSETGDDYVPYKMVDKV